MGMEVDLMVNYPRTKRDLKTRGEEKTEQDRQIARQFGKDFLMEIEKWVMEVLAITPVFGSLLCQHLKSTTILKRVIEC